MFYGRGWVAYSTLPVVALSRRRFFPLVLSIAAAVLAACSDSTQPSTPRETAQAMVGPTGGTVVTPSGGAGVQIPAGTFSQQVLVTVTQLSPSATAGEGPLPTTLKQYPPYYEITTSPAVPQLGDSVRVGVCPLTDPSSPFNAPEADHPRLRLAHTVGATVEILQLVSVSDFLRCTGVTASTQSAPSSGLKGALASIVTQAGNLLSPSPAYAAHGGLGGKVKSFSPFGAVVNACNVPVSLTLGTSVSGTIEASDCIGLADGPVDLHTFTLTAPATLRLKGTGTGFQGSMALLFDKPLKENLIFDRDLPTTNYAIIPAGNYILGLAGASPSSRGSYTIETQIVSNPAGCTGGGTLTGTLVFVFPDVSVPGAHTTNDCTGQNAMGYLDYYQVPMVAGKSYRIAAIGTGLRLEVGLHNAIGPITVLQSSGNPSGSTALTFQPATSATYAVVVINISQGKTGNYTFNVSKIP